MIPVQILAKLGFFATKKGLYLIGAIIFLLLIFFGYHEIKSSGAEAERAKWEAAQHKTQIESTALVKDAEKRIEIQKQKEMTEIKKIQEELREKNAAVDRSNYYRGVHRNHPAD